MQALVLSTIGSVTNVRAAQLSTATIFLAGGHEGECTATNVGNTRINVVVDVIDSSLTPPESITPPSTCSLGPKEACIQEIEPTGGLVRFVLCQVTSTGGRVRAVMMDAQSGTASDAR